MRDVTGLVGLWKGIDDSGADVLLRVRRAVSGEYTLTNGMIGITLYADIVEYEDVPGYTKYESFPRQLKMAMPSREVYFHVQRRKFSRVSKNRPTMVVMVVGRVHNHQLTEDELWFPKAH